MFRKIQYNLAKLLNFPIKPEENYRVQNMKQAIEQVGGKLNFTVQRHGDGWLAECMEIKGIITGGNNANPTDEEINNNIRDAVFSTFGIPPYLCKDELIRNVREAAREEVMVFT